MASTMSGSGKRSRGKVHSQVGNTIGSAVCGATGNTVIGAGYVTCRRCLKIVFQHAPRIEQREEP